jgi:hypothetical protein
MRRSFARARGAVRSPTAGPGPLRLHPSPRCRQVHSDLAQSAPEGRADRPDRGRRVPALERLRGDWKVYEDVRHFLAAKRQVRDQADAAADQLATFELWAEIGELSIETLVDDAFEVYVQLAALCSMGAIDPAPAVSGAALAALAEVEPVGDEAFLELNAASFASARPNTVALRMGGRLGGLLALVNDVAESASILARLAQVDDLGAPIERLVTCALPSEISELMRLSIGPPLSFQAHTPDSTSLLAYYGMPDKAPDPLSVLEGLSGSIAEQTKEQLLDWRDRLGAHTDEDTPWAVLEEGIESEGTSDLIGLLEWIEVNLEYAAAVPGGPSLLMLGTRQMKTLFASAGYAQGLPYDDPDVDPGNLGSALPPEHADSEYVVWVSGPRGSALTAAVAGMIAARSAEVAERHELVRKKFQS